MSERLYFVTLNNHTIAESMELDYALVFVRAMFEKYFGEHDMVIAIKEMPRGEEK